MTGERPLVSLITAVYNGARHLEDTIASVAQQTYPHIEYLVIDGGSTDGTLEIIKRHAASIRYWVSRPDGGMYYAMNEGIDRSRGEIVGIINSDDWLEPDAVATIVDEYVASDRQSVLYGVTRYHDERGLDMILSYDHRKLPTRMINHPACFVPRTLYDRFGKFDTQYRVAADYDLLLRLYARGVGFRHVEKTLANFRHGGYSSRNKSAKEVLRIRRRHGYLTTRQYVIASGVRVARRAVNALFGRR